MNRSESSVLQEVLIRGQSPTSRLWRNNSGVAVYVKGNPELCPCCGYRRPVQRVAYGIPSGGGGADLIGIDNGGRFVAVEAKSATGRADKSQLDFLRLVARLGGLAQIADPDEIITLDPDGRMPNER